MAKYTFPLEAIETTMKEYGWNEIIGEYANLTVEQAVAKFGEQASKDCEHLDNGGSIGSYCDAFFYYHSTGEAGKYGFTETMPYGEFDDIQDAIVFYCGQIMVYSLAIYNKTENAVVYYDNMEDAKTKEGF